MKSINTVKSILLGVAVLLLLGTPMHSAHAAKAKKGKASADGTAKVSAIMPEFIILHYYSKLDLTFDAPDLKSALDEGTNNMDVTWKGRVHGNSELGPKNLKGADLDMNDVVNISIPKVWAVRGFAPNGKAKVSISIPSGGSKLKKGKSEIGLSNIKVVQGKNSGRSIKIALNGISKRKATVGGVSMNMNFKKTTFSGKHTGGLYKITATTI